MKLFLSILPGAGIRRVTRFAAAMIAASFIMGVGKDAVARHPGYNCQAVVDAKLAEHGVALDNVASRKTVHQRTGGEANLIEGYSTWVALKSCKGNVVVDLSLECDIEQAYVSGNCSVKGLKSY